MYNLTLSNKEHRAVVNIRKFPVENIIATLRQKFFESKHELPALQNSDVK